jgi:hypothetical protein
MHNVLDETWNSFYSADDGDVSGAQGDGKIWLFSILPT